MTRQFYRFCGPLALTIHISLATTACVIAPGKIVGETHESSETAATGGDSGDSGTTGATTLATASDAGEAGDTGTGGTGALVCDAYPAHGCAEPFDCSARECGGLSELSPEGCMRSRCRQDTDCPGGGYCFSPGCTSSNVSCSDEMGTCSCLQTDDCGGAYCIDEPPPGCVQYPDHGCTGAIDCSVSGDCGMLQPFTAHGCLRTRCDQNGDSDCGGDERCYRPQDFGGCTSSGLDCSDDPATMTCQCTADADCGGAFCIPASDYPEDPKPCADYPAHSCSEPVDCERYPCGDRQAFSEQGCLRVACDLVNPCGECEICHRPEDEGLCAASIYACDDDPTTGECSCGGTDDCGGAYCIPDPECRAQG